MPQHALMFATKWGFQFLPAYRPKSWKHLSVVMAPTFPESSILVARKNMIEQFPLPGWAEE